MQAWEWIAMKKNENILQGGIPRKTHLEHFGAFWSIIKIVLGHQKTEIS